MTTNLQVIAVSGKAGSGKDFVFENYLKPRGFHRWALADHFKIWLIGKGHATYDEVFYTKPPHVRKELQLEGTERGRDVYGDTVWLETAHAWMQHLNNTWGVNKFCITDCRFPNEVEYVRNVMGGKVVRIHAPNRSANSSLNEEARRHPSETALDTYTNFDYVLHNDYNDNLDSQLPQLYHEFNI